jgi:hypothetical protein
MLERGLTKQYEVVPRDHPYRCFQFLDLDGQPSLEIVAEEVQISRRT